VDAKVRRGRGSAKGPVDHAVVGMAAPGETEPKARPGKRHVPGTARQQPRAGAALRGESRVDKFRPTRRHINAASKRDQVCIGDGTVHASPTKADTSYASSSARTSGSSPAAYGVPSFRNRRRMARRVPNAADPKQAAEWDSMMSATGGGPVAGMTTSKRGDIS